MTDSRPVSPEGPAPLPCPFCGNAGRVQPRSHSDRWHTGNGDWLVVCPGNGCAARVGATREEAIAAWNRRPSRAAGSELDAIAEELRALANEYAPKVGYLVMADKLNRIAATVRSAALSGNREDSDTKLLDRVYPLTTNAGNPLPLSGRALLRNMAESEDRARSTPAAQET